MTRDLAQRLEQMAAFLKHGDAEDIAKWETQDQIRSLLREAASAVGIIHALLGPEKFSCKRIGPETMRLKITADLGPEEIEMLIPLFAEHA